MCHVCDKNMTYRHTDTQTQFKFNIDSRIQLGPPHHPVTFSSEEHFNPNLSLDELSEKEEGGDVDQVAVHTGKSVRLEHSPRVQLEDRQDHEDHLV